MDTQKQQKLVVLRKIVCIFLLLGVSITTAAENILVGRVLDKTTKQVIDFANVAITRSGDSAPLTGVTTDTDGQFSISGLANGQYTLTISFIGYATISKDIVLTGKKIDLGKLFLIEDSKTLQEVEVVGQGTQMRFELDKKVFSVDQTLAAAGGNVTDILENIPSIDVDQEGQISLRNSEAVEIWINGKPAGLTEENRAQILEQMPAGSIKEVEIITNPSAKYSPEGTAGIINLVMRKETQSGFYGSVNGRINYCMATPWTVPPGGEAGINFNFTKGIVSGYVNAGYHYHTSNGRSQNDRYNLLRDTTRLKKDGRTERNGGGLFLRAGLDIRITEKSTIGLSGFGTIETMNDPTGGAFSNRSFKPTHYSLYDIDEYIGPQNEQNKETLKESYDRDEDGRGSHPGGNAMIDWRMDINKAHKVSASAQYSDFQHNSDNYYIQRDYQIETKEISSENKEEQLSTNRDRSVQLKADYEWKPNEQSRLEAGWQTTLAWRTTYADAWNGTDRQNQLLDYYNEFRNYEQNHALYITYGNRFWDCFSVQVGLRGEYFTRHIESKFYDTNHQLQQAKQDTSYFQLFPSVYLSYTFGQGHELQFNYTRRVDRPRGWQINPRQNFSDITNISSGNPSLLPQYSSALELNYLKLWDRHTLSAGLFYRYADNVIQRISYMNEAQMYSTFINLSKRHEAGVELVAKNKVFGEILNLTTTLDFYYNRLDGAEYTPWLNGRSLSPIQIQEQNIFAFSAKLNIGLLFTKTFSGQISGRYRSPRVTAQGKTSHSYAIDINLRKTFLDRKLALVLGVRDILNSRARNTTTNGEGFWQWQENRWNSRMLNFSISYNFGNMKRKNEKNGTNTTATDSMDQWNEGSDE